MGIVLLTLREALLSTHYIILFLEVHLVVGECIPIRTPHVAGFQLASFRLIYSLQLNVIKKLFRQ